MSGLATLPEFAWQLIVEALQPRSLTDALCSLQLPAVSRDLYASPELAWALAAAVGFTMKKVSPRFRGEEELCLRALRRLRRRDASFALEYLHDLLESLPTSCMTRAVAVEVWSLKPSARLPGLERWRTHRGTLLQLLSRDSPASFRWAQQLPNVMHFFPAFRLDREVALAAVRGGWQSIFGLPETLRRDRQVALAAVGFDGLVAPLLDRELLEDAGFVDEAIRANGDVLMVLGSRLNFDQAMLAVRSFPLDGLAGLPSTLVRRHPKLWKTAVQLDARAVAYAPHEQLTRDDVLAALRRCPSCLLALREWREDRDLLFEALTLKGSLFARMSQPLRFDRRLALAALGNDGMALEFVPEALMDLELLRVALTQNGLALAFARAGRSDGVCVAIAVAQNPEAAHFSRLQRC